MKISFRGVVWVVAFAVICPAVWVGIVSAAGVLFNIF